MTQQRKYDVASGVQSFQVSWTSKASASQRAGRAGRTGPGHCYRIYSSAIFENHFDKFSVPEILRMPIEGVVLQMKGMNIDAVANFPFPTPPDRQALRKAENILTHLGALAPAGVSKKAGAAGGVATIGGRITELGKAMAMFPVSPRYAKMLVVGQQHGCLPYVIAVVAALSVGDPFLREDSMEAGGGAARDEAEQLEAAETGIGAEVVHITNEQIREKEERKLQKRKFYQTQQVSLPTTPQRLLI